MKHSKKYLRSLKKKLIGCTLSIIASVALITGSNSALFTAPINALENIKNSISTAFSADDGAMEFDTPNVVAINDVATTNDNSEIAQIAYTGTRLANTDTITYIYDEQDLLAFKNAVNAGNNYSGKTVYLMNDIDLTSVCSATAGTWVPIGNTTSAVFRGTFDGNNYTIQNLYISSSANLGLFGFNYGTIQNVTVRGSLRATSTYAGGIAGRNYGTIKNCKNYVNITTTSSQAGGITGLNNVLIDRCMNYGTITGNSSSAALGGIIGTNASASAIVQNCGNQATVTGGMQCGGISGTFNYGKMYNCYNSGTITGNGKNANGDSMVGGITGYFSANAVSYIYNCYNKGTVKGPNGGEVGGIVGGAYSATTINKYLYNCYNIATISGGHDVGSIVGRGKNLILNKCYYTTSQNPVGMADTTPSQTNVAKVAVATLQTYTVTLGSAYAYDVYNINGGYPVLAWQNERTVMNLNKNQEYIKVGQELQLSVVEEDAITRIIGNNYGPRNFEWTSTNEDVATVSPDGIVKGLSDGYTTIYAYHRNSGMYAMSIINVAKDFANPQIGTGNGFTAILKSDGTVWTIGNNASGQLGQGDNVGARIARPVKTDIDTELTNIVKIAVGSDHVLALADNGKVYAWGANGNGQLGQNNTNSSSYAKIVLGEDGQSDLTNIVDIDAGGLGSVALDMYGNVYVWGNGSYGEIGNSATASKNLPTKVQNVKHAIQVQIERKVGVLTSDGVVWAWGLNTSGQLGINCTNNTSYPMKTALNVTEIALVAGHTTVKKVDGSLYTVGAYTYGRLGTGSTANQTKYVAINLQNIVTEDNPVKYIKAGITNTTILLKDGSVWETGYNLQGELGIGTSNTTATTFVQGLTGAGTPIENVLTIGKNVGNINGSATAGFGLNTAVILKNGDIYSAGYNGYGQIGNNSTQNALYYTKMAFAELDYADKVVEVNEEGYQIERSKLKYIQSAVNVYNDEVLIELGDEVEFTILDESLATVDKSGMIKPKDGATGVTKVKIEDLTNGYETYFTLIVNRLHDTDEVIYIYTIEDLVRFRNSVNAGNNYKGKTVYVMADIDMSEACSAKLGSWTPIGNTDNNRFSGIFKGNNHKIENLYISSTGNLGLFGFNYGIIENVIVTGSLKATSMYVGGIAGRNYGTIRNCKNYVKISTTSSAAGGIAGCTTVSIENCMNYGTITGTSASEQIGGIVGASHATSVIIQNCGNEANITGGVNCGGITGTLNHGKIYSCYNKGAITGNGKNANGDAMIGGITGYFSYSSASYIYNCYNRGTVRGANGGEVGGIAGGAFSKTTINKTIANCYNTGTISGNHDVGSIVGRGKNLILNNCHWTSTQAAVGMADTTPSQTNVGKRTAAVLKTYAPTLGKAFENDDFKINDEYPILWWEAPTIELNKKQAYIKENEELQLNIILNERVEGIFGADITVQNFDWTSSNSDIATVDSDAKVKGLKEGYTTIYGHYKGSELYVMCIVNVAKEEATPQIETGENFTAILKPDGTVWTIGNNANGQLGQGNVDGVGARCSVPSPTGKDKRK